MGIRRRKKGGVPVTWINLAAILFSPVIAVVVTLWWQSRKEKRDLKHWILRTLITNRETPVTTDNVRALNLVELAFHDSNEVRRIWGEFFALLNQKADATPDWNEKSRKKNLELIVEMAKILGYGKVITAFNADRRYFPIGMAEQMNKQNELLDELLRVLKASGGVQFVPKPGAN
jgi:hypothetical protein